MKRPDFEVLRQQIIDAYRLRGDEGKDDDDVTALQRRHADLIAGLAVAIESEIWNLSHSHRGHDEGLVVDLTERDMTVCLMGFSALVAPALFNIARLTDDPVEAANIMVSGIVHYAKQMLELTNGGRDEPAKTSQGDGVDAEFVANIKMPMREVPN
jgi:hypothetical protein